MARTARYYEKYGEGCDAIVRCADCRRIDTLARLLTLGTCECGCRRVKEVTTLSGEEMARIAELDFPHKDEFLAEFTRVE